MVNEFLNATQGDTKVEHKSLAGVVLSRFPSDSSKWSDGSSVEYKLRFPSSLRCMGDGTSTNPLANNDHWFTRFIFPEFQKVGPRSNSTTQGGAPCK